MTKPTRRKRTITKPAPNASVEKIIRDKLAANLALIEPGLRLIKKEHWLPATENISGSVDILAQDRFDCYVIIEVKTADTSSREALHEILKYRALLAHHFGLDLADIRCVIASTIWRELRRPFSDFAREFPLMVRGYELQVGEDGDLLSAVEIDLLPPIATPVPWPEETFLFFADAQSRERTRKLVPALLKANGFEHYLLTWLDLKPEARRPFPHALRISVACFTEPETEEDWERRHQELRASDDDSDDPARSLEELRICRVLAGLRTHSMYEEMESCSSSAKFMSMMASWKIADVEREGRYPGGPDTKSEQYVDRMTGVAAGDNPFMHRNVVSSRNAQKWRDVAKRLDRFLARYNREWRAACAWFLKSLHEEGDIEVNIFVGRSPNLLMALSNAADRLDSKDFSRMMLSASVAGRVICALEGRLVWDRCEFPDNPAQVLKRLFGERGLHGNWFRAHEYEEQILAAHGLRLGAFYGRFSAENEKSKICHVELGSGGIAVEPASHELSSFSDFLSVNRKYLLELRTLLNAQICTLCGRSPQ